MSLTKILRRTEIVHRSYGRVRLRHWEGRYAPAVLEEIRGAVAVVPGVEHVDVRPGSGSVVVSYDPDKTAEMDAFLDTVGPDRAAVAPTFPKSSPQKAPPARAAGAASRRGPAPPITKVDEAVHTVEAEAEFLAEHSTAARVVVDFARDLDDKLKRATNNNIDLKIMVPIGLAAVTFIEIGAAAATPMWVTLVIFSLNHFVELHAHDDDDDDDEEDEDFEFDGV